MKLVILDRDGTINQERKDFVKSEGEWVPMPGALEAIAKLTHAGWHVVIASNQSGLGRGLFDIAALNAMHSKMHKLTAAAGGKIDAVFYCPHTSEDACTCRKPLPGLFTQIGERYKIDLKGTPSVGDSLRDMQASMAAGCAPHLVRTGNGRKTEAEKSAELPPGTQVHEDLAAFVEMLLSQAKSARQGSPRAVAVEMPGQGAGGA